MDGTTNKRTRRTKGQVEAERLQESQESSDRQKQERQLRRALGSTGVFLHVRAKVGGRVVRHRIAVTRRGQVLFVDHGMCSPEAMIAEMELRKLTLRDILQTEVCFAVALLLVRPQHPYVRDIPVEPERGSAKQMTTKLRELYSEETYRFIRALKEKRRARSQMNLDRRNVEMKPFHSTVSSRVRALLENIQYRVMKKEAQVEKYLIAKGYPQSHTTYGYHAKPGKLPP